MAITGNSTKIEEALNYFLNTLVLVPTRRIAWDALAFEPQTAEYYLVPSFVPNQTGLAEIGTGAPRRHTGLYQVNVHGPWDKATVVHGELADAVIEHFFRQVIARNGLTVRIGSFNGVSNPAPSRAPDFQDKGLRVTPVSVPWWCDDFPA